MRTLTLFVLLALAAVSGVAAQDAFTRRANMYDGHVVIRIDDSNLTAEQSKLIQELPERWGLDVWSETDFRLSPVQRTFVESELKAAGISFSNFIEDVGAEIKREDMQLLQYAMNKASNNGSTPSNDWFSSYHNLEEIIAFYKALQTENPKFVSGQVIGKSYEGRDMYVFRVTAPSPAPKPAIFIEAGIHAREWISPATVAFLAQALVQDYSKDSRIKKLMDSFEYHFVPSTNPDGYVYTHTKDRMHRKTVKPNPGSSCIGTDPNRNWDNHFCEQGASRNPCSETYCGAAPFDNPETKNIANYVAKTSNVVAFLDVHSYSQLWMQPYAYTAKLPANNKQQQEAGDAAVKALAQRYGTKFRNGPVYTTIYPSAGSSIDWAFDNTTHVKYAYAIELRDTGRYGFLLPPEQIIPSGLETLDAIMAMSEYILNNLSVNKEGKQVEQAVTLGQETKIFDNMIEYVRRGEENLEMELEAAVLPVEADVAPTMPRKVLKD